MKSYRKSLMQNLGIPYSRPTQSREDKMKKAWGFNYIEPQGWRDIMKDSLLNVVEHRSRPQMDTPRLPKTIPLDPDTWHQQTARNKFREYREGGGEDGGEVFAKEMMKLHSGYQEQEGKYALDRIQAEMERIQERISELEREEEEKKKGIIKWGYPIKRRRYRRRSHRRSHRKRRRYPRRSLWGRSRVRVKVRSP